MNKRPVGVSLKPEEFKLIVDNLPDTDEGNKLKKELIGISAKNKKGNDVMTKMEELYPETMTEFRNILSEQYRIFSYKQSDYGPGNISMNGNKDLAVLGLGVRMNDKTQRVLNLAYNKQDPNNESLVDSFSDLSVYGVIAQIVLNDKWGK